MPNGGMRLLPDKIPASEWLICQPQNQELTMHSDNDPESNEPKGFSLFELEPFTPQQEERIIEIIREVIQSDAL